MRPCASDEALNNVEIADIRHFYRLAALQIRRELIDLCRHYQGPLGLGANHHTQRPVSPNDGTAPLVFYDRAEMSADPRHMQEWGEFHQHVESLPEKEREVFELIWYHELTQDEAAEVLGISTRQVKRICARPNYFCTTDCTANLHFDVKSSVDVTAMTR